MRKWKKWAALFGCALVIGAVILLPITASAQETVITEVFEPIETAEVCGMGWASFPNHQMIGPNSELFFDYITAENVRNAANMFRMVPMYGVGDELTEYDLFRFSMATLPENKFVHDLIIDGAYLFVPLPNKAEEDYTQADGWRFAFQDMHVNIFKVNSAVFCIEYVDYDSGGYWGVKDYYEVHEERPDGWVMRAQLAKREIYNGGMYPIRTIWKSEITTRAGASVAVFAWFNTSGQDWYVPGGINLRNVMSQGRFQVTSPSSATATGEIAYNHGYADGYFYGYDDGQLAGTNLAELAGGVVSAEVNIFSSLFDFEIFGVNVLSALLALFTLALVIIVIKVVLQ